MHKFLVYKLQRYDTFGNSHAVNRHETWEFQISAGFDTEEAAKEYIRGMTRTNVAAFKILTEGLQDSELETFLDEFCFGTRYVHQNDYFIGKPADRIKAALQNNGVIIEQKN